MILLENHSVIIHDVLTERFVKPSKLDIQFVDYDNVRFHLSTPSSKTQILLSLAIQCWPDIQRYGARQLLESEYGEWLLPEAETEPEYNVSLVIDLEKVPAEGEDSVALISHLSLLKRAALSAPFLRAFETQSKLGASFAATNVPSQQEQAAPEQGELMQIRPREDEAIYIQASHDRVTVVFSTVFKEETDREFGKIFLQEFVDARRQQSMQNAPQVMYSSREPPLEIRHMPGLATSENVGYVTFVLFPRHFANPEMAIATTARIQLFRDYLHYHIKCSKAYMHSRMRHRVAEFLKVLNRAKPEVAVGERKTASGRTFRSR